MACKCFGNIEVFCFMPTNHFHCSWQTKGRGKGRPDFSLFVTKMFSFGNINLKDQKQKTRHWLNENISQYCLTQCKANFKVSCPKGGADGSEARRHPEDRIGAVPEPTTAVAEAAGRRNQTLGSQHGWGPVNSLSPPHFYAGLRWAWPPTPQWGTTSSCVHQSNQSCVPLAVLSSGLLQE